MQVSLIPASCFQSLFAPFRARLFVTICFRTSGRDGLVIFMPDPLFKDMRLSHTGIGFGLIFIFWCVRAEEISPFLQNVQRFVESRVTK